MKNKTFDKKLVLNKATIADLAEKDMKNVKGGNYWNSYVDPTACACESQPC